MRKAVIDLDWVNQSILEYERVINDNLVSEELATIYNHLLNAFIEVRSKCSPIEPFLSKTCTNNWEDNKFCDKEGSCELCKIKQ